MPKQNKWSPSLKSHQRLEGSIDGAERWSRLALRRDRWRIGLDTKEASDFPTLRGNFIHGGLDERPRVGDRVS